MVSCIHSDQVCTICEEAFHYHLNEEFETILQEKGFCSIKWTVLQIMQEQIGIELKHEHLDFLRKLEKEVT